MVGFSTRKVGVGHESLEAEFCADDLGPGQGLNQISFRKAPQILQKVGPTKTWIEGQSPKIPLLPYPLTPTPNPGAQPCQPASPPACQHR